MSRFLISVGQRSPGGTSGLHVGFMALSTNLPNLQFHFFTYCTISNLVSSSHPFISSHHWPSRRHTGSDTVRPGVATTASHLSLMRAACSILPAQRNCGRYWGFSSPTSEWSFLTGSPDIPPSMIIHQSRHLKQQTWVYGNWVSMCVCRKQLHFAHVYSQPVCERFGWLTVKCCCVS